MRTTTRRMLTLLALLASLTLLASACGGDDDDSTATDDGATEDAATDDGATDDAAQTDDAAAPAADLQLVESDLGSILVDSGGNTIYLFTQDAQGDSTCYDQCEAAWPVVSAASAVGDGLDAGLLGSIERTDGTTQATYNGWPLYYFANDAAAGDTNGQGANDVWWVVGADGNAVQAG